MHVTLLKMQNECLRKEKKYWSSKKKKKRTCLRVIKPGFEAHLKKTCVMWSCVKMDVCFYVASCSILLLFLLIIEVDLLLLSHSQARCLR